MAFAEQFRQQVSLLVRTIPLVAEESCFALKGGTAINLFVRDLPRLSVDIDLTFLPVTDRGQALVDIDAALKRIGKRIQAMNPRFNITESAPSSQSSINKLVIRTPQRLQVKIEVTPVLRGCVYEPERKSVSERTEEEFGYAEMDVLSIADLYAGKVVAALDRQHPRDLFDVHHLFENEGLTEELRKALVVYLISHDHSPQSLLAPKLRDIEHSFGSDFVGMTEENITLEMLYAARARLINAVISGMTSEQKAFLVSFYEGSPDWDKLGLSGVAELPAVKWRQLNLDRAGTGTRAEIVRQLTSVLEL